MGVWFDRLCAFSENNVLPHSMYWSTKQPIKNMLKESSVFEIYGQCEIGPISTRIFLPFQSTALETENGIFIMRETPMTNFFDVIFLQGPIGSPHGPQGYVVGVGTVEYSVDEEMMYKGSVKPIAIFQCTERKMRIDKQFREWNLRDPVKERIGIAFMSMNFGVAVSCLSKINSPSKFIFETTPTSVRPNHIKSGLILRTHERPTYTLLTPGAIQKRFGYTGTTTTAHSGGPKAPHPRRAHMRTFHHPKYKANQGKSILIPACWVGPSEFKEGNKIYRVRLDK